MTYVVLGMHKSGTTLVAEILHRSGIPMVESTSEADYYAGNKWERESTLAFDKDVLDAHDVDSLWLAPPDPDSLVDEGRLERARQIATHAGAIGEWGFKDPRACLTWPLWQRALRAPKVVGVYRPYGAVVRHFGSHAARAHRRGPLRRLRMEWLALRRWCEYNERLLEAIDRAQGPAILLSYERLMDGNAELDRLRRFVGRELADPRDPERFKEPEREGRRDRFGARVAQLLGAGSATAIWARLEATRATQLARMAGLP
jgi:hypothetical protein